MSWSYETIFFVKREGSIFYTKIEALSFCENDDIIWYRKKFLVVSRESALHALQISSKRTLIAVNATSSLLQGRFSVERVLMKVAPLLNGTVTLMTKKPPYYCDDYGRIYE